MIKKRNKMNNRKVVLNNIQFDSKLESEFYLHLNDLKDKHLIKDFRMKERFLLLDSFSPTQTGEDINFIFSQLDKDRKRTRISYIPDFVIVLNDNSEIVVDTKGHKTDSFMMKKKLFESKYDKKLFLVKKQNKKWIEVK